MSPDHLTQLIITYRYWIVVPLTFLEGPIVAFVVGTLSAFGYFNPFIAVWIFFLKDMIMDTGFYFLGRYAKNTRFVKRMLHKEGLINESVGTLREQWRTHSFRTMFVAKLPHGFSSVFLTMSGLIEAPLPRFMFYGAIIALAQYGLLFVVGYYFGSLIGVTAGTINTISYILTGLLLVGTAYYIVVWYLRRRFRQKNGKGIN